MYCSLQRASFWITHAQVSGILWNPAGPEQVPPLYCFAKPRSGLFIVLQCSASKKHGPLCMDCRRAGGKEEILTGVCKVETSSHVCVCHSPTWVLQGHCRAELFLLALRLKHLCALLKKIQWCLLSVRCNASLWWRNRVRESSRLEKTNIIQAYPESHHRAVSLSATSTNTPGTGMPPKPH